MSILKWLRRPMATIRRQRSSCAPAAQRYRPRLEVLEQRTTPSGDFGMAFRIGAKGADHAHSVSLDSGGNPHITGFFQQTVDFDPGPGVFNLTSISLGDEIFVAKYTPAGDLIWAASMQSQNENSQGWGTAVTVDGAGNVYTTGWFRGTVDFDPGPSTFLLTSTGGSDVFVSKLDRNGNFVWARNFGSPGVQPGPASAVRVDGAGNVYTTGNFSGTADFNPGSATFNLTSAGGSDIFVSKLDSAGNLVWARSMGGIRNDQGYALAVDGSGNVSILGVFEETADFDPATGTFHLTSAGDGDIFLAKLDNAGNFVWAKSMGGAARDTGIALTVDGAGNLYSTGSFAGTADFDPGPATFNLVSAAFTDVFVSKLDANGNFIWARRLGGNGFEAGQAIALDRAGSVYTSGGFGGSADFDPGPSTFQLTGPGLINVFVSKLDAAGDFVWARHMSSSSSANSRGIAVDLSGNVYTTGTFTGTADFDPGPGTFNLTAANSDIFVSRLMQMGQVSSYAGGDGQLFALAEGGAVWRYTVGAARWDPLGAFGAGLTVGNLGDDDPANDLVFLHGFDHSVWVWSENGWRNTKGWLRTLVAGDNQVFGIGFDGQLWQFHVDNGWTASRGFGVTIDVGNDGDGDSANDLVLLKGFDGRIWLWDQHSWRFTRGYLDQIVAGDDQVFGIGYDGQVWRFHIDNGWTASGRHGTSIAVGNLGDSDAATDLVFLQSDNDSIWLWNQQAWKFTGGHLHNLVAGDGQVFGLDADGQLWRFHLRSGWAASGGFGTDLDLAGVGDANSANDLVMVRGLDGELSVWDHKAWISTGA